MLRFFSRSGLLVASHIASIWVVRSNLARALGGSFKNSLVFYLYFSMISLGGHEYEHMYYQVYQN
jgi:hypothetical protein